MIVNVLITSFAFFFNRIQKLELMNDKTERELQELHDLKAESFRIKYVVLYLAIHACICSLEGLHLFVTEVKYSECTTLVLPQVTVQRTRRGKR